MDSVLYFSGLISSLILCIWLMKRFSLFSCEGLTIFFATTYIFTDCFQIFNALFVGKIAVNNELWDYDELISLRVKSTFIFLISFICFGLGVELSSMWKKRQNQFPIYSKSEEKYLRMIGIICAISGLLMFVIGLFAEGVSSISQLYDRMYDLSWEVKRFAFLDYGWDLYSIGFALIAVSCSVIWKQGFWLMLSILISIVISTSKSGMQYAILAFYSSLFIYKPQDFKKWLRPYVFIVFLIILIFSAGIKTQLKYQESGSAIETDITSLVEITLVQLGRRFSSIGTYHGYSTLVERLDYDPTMHAYGKALHFGLISWVPRFLWPDKPTTPTQGLGYLINTYGIIDEKSSDTLTLTGMWYWDLGYYGITVGMFFTGLLFSYISNFLRKYSIAIGQAPAFLFWIFCGQYFAGYTSLGANIIFMLVLLGVFKIYSKFSNNFKAVIRFWRSTPVTNLEYNKIAY